MKRLLTFTLFCYSLGAITSCSKSLTDTPESPSLNTLGDSKTLRLDTTTDLTDLLTGQTWIYYEYFKNFNDTATLAWKTNRSSNTLNLSLNRVQYYPNGNYTEITENGTTLYGQWIFLNNQTEVQVTNPNGVFVSTIQELTGNRYEWLAGNGNYGVMVPQNQVIDTTGGRLQLLTSQPWIYTEYFNNFNLTSPSLVWKPNKANSPLNLSQNVVKYNVDGTYWEIDQNGTFYNGYWSFQNNQTEVQVTNSLGTFTSTIKVLGTDRYEWLSTNGIAYGEMIHQ
jgi:hypothetical protein